MAQIKPDRKITCLSSLTTVDIFSENRSHGGNWKGRNFTSLWKNGKLDRHGNNN